MRGNSSSLETNVTKEFPRKCGWEDWTVKEAWEG